MLNNNFCEKFYAHHDISHCVPVIYQTIFLIVLENIIEEIKEENPYASISELLDE